MFRRRMDESPQQVVRENDYSDFELLNNFVKKLESKADLDKAKEAMESIFNAHQKIRGIRSSEKMVDATGGFVVHKDEGK